MELKNRLTNEEIMRLYEEQFHLPNQFDLVNYSISQATQMIRSGRSPRVKTQTENTALIILEEILKGADRIEEPEEKKQANPMAMTTPKKEKIQEDIQEEEGIKETVHTE